MKKGGHTHAEGDHSELRALTMAVLCPPGGVGSSYGFRQYSVVLVKNKQRNVSFSMVKYDQILGRKGLEHTGSLNYFL